MNKIIAANFILFILATVAVFAPQITRQDPNAMFLSERLQPPSLLHPLGQDENGSDVFTKLIYGARVSLIVSFSVVILSLSIGLSVGSAAALNKRVDLIVTRIVDMFVAFPGFLVALAFVAMLGPSLKNMIFALSMTSWTPFARLVRGEVMYLKEREHIQAARALGINSLRILIVHIWPNLLGLVAVQASFAMASTIISESGLSFLGLGVPSTIPTWGSLLSSGRRFMTEAPHISFAPGMAILLSVLAFNLLGDGVREQLDPRRGRNSN